MPPARAARFPRRRCTATRRWGGLRASMDRARFRPPRPPTPPYRRENLERSLPPTESAGNAIHALRRERQGIAESTFLDRFAGSSDETIDHGDVARQSAGPGIGHIVGEGGDDVDRFERQTEDFRGAPAPDIEDSLAADRGAGSYPCAEILVECRFDRIGVGVLAGQKGAGALKGEAEADSPQGPSSLPPRRLRTSS